MRRSRRQISSAQPNESSPSAPTAASTASRLNILDTSPARATPSTRDSDRSNISGTTGESAGSSPASSSQPSRSATKVRASSAGSTESRSAMPDPTLRARAETKGRGRRKKGKKGSRKRSDLAGDPKNPDVHQIYVRMTAQIRSAARQLAPNKVPKQILQAIINDLSSSLTELGILTPNHVLNFHSIQSEYRGNLASGLHVYGLALLKSGENQRAAGWIEAALPLIAPKTDTFMLNNLGEALRAIGQLEKAREVYRKAVRAGKRQAKKGLENAGGLALSNLALMSHHEGDWHAAVNFAEKRSR